MARGSNGRASIEGREGGFEKKVLEDGCEEWLQGEGVSGVVWRGCVKSGCEEGVTRAVVRRGRD